MSALTCPHCGLRALPAYKKLMLGGVYSAPCRRCGLLVCMSPLDVLSILPLVVFVLLIMLKWLRNPVAIVALGLLVFTACCLLRVFAVPLCKAQMTDRHAVARAHEENRR